MPTALSIEPACVALAKCPACGVKWSAAATVRIPVARLADEMLDDSLRQMLPELVYERCATCGALVATDVRRDPQLLHSIYDQLPASYWNGLNAQTGLNQIIEGRLRERGIVQGDLWDVGCGNGNLLDSLGVQWTKRGIEPGRRAVEEARRRNLAVEIGTAASLRLREVADVVLLIDVAEHLPDPEIELRAVYEMLRPGGVILLLTGKADAWTARFAGPRWYYLHCVGHVTIFSFTSFDRLLRRLGFIDVVGYPVEHPGSVGMRRWLRRIGGNALRRVAGRHPAAMHYYRDHQLILATKPVAGCTR